MRPYTAHGPDSEFLIGYTLKKLVVNQGRAPASNLSTLLSNSISPNGKGENI